MDTQLKPDEPEQPEPALTRRQIGWALAGMLLLLALPLPFVWWRSDAPSEYGALLQGLAGTAALALLLLTLHLQRRELHLQREELRNQRKEMQASTAEQAGQRQVLEQSLAASVRPILRAEVTTSGDTMTGSLRNVGPGTGYVKAVTIVGLSEVPEPFFKTFVLKLRELGIPQNGRLWIDAAAVVRTNESVRIFTFPCFLTSKTEALTLPQDSYERWLGDYVVEITFEDINGREQKVVAHLWESGPS